MKKLIILALAATMFASCGKKAEEDGFAWNKATAIVPMTNSMVAAPTTVANA